MGYSPPSFSVHGISQARILDWVAISSSRDLPDPEIELISPAYPALAGEFFTTEPPEKSKTLTALFFITYPRLQAPIYMIPSDSPWWGQNSSGTSLLCSSLIWQRINIIFLFPPSSVSVFLFSIGGQGAKILAVTE